MLYEFILQFKDLAQVGCIGVSYFQIHHFHMQLHAYYGLPPFNIVIILGRGSQVNIDGAFDALGTYHSALVHRVGAYKLILMEHLMHLGHIISALVQRVEGYKLIT